MQFPATLQGKNRPGDSPLGATSWHQRGLFYQDLGVGIAILRDGPDNAFDIIIFFVVIAWDEIIFLIIFQVFDVIIPSTGSGVSRFRGRLFRFWRGFYFFGFRLFSAPHFGQSAGVLFKS